MKNPFPAIRSTLNSVGSRCRALFTHPFIQSSTDPPATKSFARAWLTGRDDTVGVGMITSPLQQSSWVYACVTTLADTISAIPFRFVDSSSSSSSSSTANPSSIHHHLSSLFDHPHPQLDRFQFWELIVSWLCLRGEAFIFPISDSTSRPLRPSVKNLLVLNPDNLHEIIRDGELAGWRYSHGHAVSSAHVPGVFLPEDLIHIKTPNPYNFWRGLSPLTVAWLAAQTDYAAAQFMKGTMINNADTGLIVSSSDQLSPEQIEEITAAITNRKRSAGSADRPLFVWGNTRVERPTMSVVDLQFLENRKFNRQEICAIFKVPQEILGFTEDANRSVSESARLNFMENRIVPLCRRLEAAFQPLIDRLASSSSSSSKLRGEFHVKGTPIMQAAQRERVRTATELFMLGVPMDVINTQLDLGLPPLPHGRDSYLPTRVQKVGTLPSPPETRSLQGNELDSTSNPAVAACNKIMHSLERLKESGFFEGHSPQPSHGSSDPDKWAGLLDQVRKINRMLQQKDPP